MNELIKNIVLTGVLTFLLFVPLMAQGSPPGTPIDGGLSLLLAAGGVYGAKKLMNRKNR